MSIFNLKCNKSNISMCSQPVGTDSPNHHWQALHGDACTPGHLWPHGMLPCRPCCLGMLRHSWGGLDQLKHALHLSLWFLKQPVLPFLPPHSLPLDSTALSSIPSLTKMVGFVTKIMVLDSTSWIRKTNSNMAGEGDITGNKYSGFSNPQSLIPSPQHAAL